MQSNGTRAKMDFSKLEETIDKLHEFVGAPEQHPANGGRTEFVETCEKATQYLEWLAEMLDNRRLYHKKQNAKKKLAEQLIKKMLSPDELKELDKQASEMIGDVHNPNTEE